jgi:leucyl-tRNA synthetase
MQALSYQNEKFNITEPFKGLFTQGMVCHETYKDENNNWVSPDEVISMDGKKFLKEDNTKVIKVGPSESMSKSKKNTIDPEYIINSYGADSVRLFILSDSPPEKDVQWSEQGITASYKFMQKLWSLNKKVLEEMKKDYKKDVGTELTNFTNKFIKKMTNNLENFQYNVIIANLHEMCSFLVKEIVKKYQKTTILDNYKKILITMTPIVPHFTNECLESLSENNKIIWPDYEETFTRNKENLIVIQINGKKRALISAKPNLNENDLIIMINKNKNLKKYFIDKEIKRKIYIKDKLINIIVSN